MSHARRSDENPDHFRPQWIRPGLSHRENSQDSFDCKNLPSRGQMPTRPVSRPRGLADWPGRTQSPMTDARSDFPTPSETPMTFDAQRSFQFLQGSLSAAQTKENPSMEDDPLTKDDPSSKAPRPTFYI